MHFIFAGSNFSSETAALELGIPIFRDKDEWRKWEKLGDPVFHIEFRRWAGALVVAPLDANTLAKIVHGQCDNLLTCIIRAWDWTKPMFLCPAMNTMMWENKPTANQIREMSDRGAYIIKPTEKKLACNDVGMGAMAPVADIVRFVNDKLRWKFPLEKCNGIPINHHPGAFGFHRRKNHHTGVDLYCEDNDAVHAVEDGIIVKIGVFTGPKAGHDWWEETYGIMIEGASGVVNYGEVTPHIETIVAEGKRIQRGQFIGRVKRVLFPDKLRKDIPGHSTSMLHLELYKHGARDFADWHDPQKNPTLLDPTRFLMDAEGAPRITLTWDNDQNKTVG
jgi:phosphopantothenoylcysteine decarboxylase